MHPKETETREVTQYMWIKEKWKLRQGCGCNTVKQQWHNRKFINKVPDFFKLKSVLYHDYEILPQNS